MESTIENIRSEKSWNHARNKLKAYDFAESRGFKNVTEAICCMGRIAYHREFKKFKEEDQKL